ncbi:hypothetical protein NQ036_03815 [Brevibacterium sp. 91QC2O2]|uniref:hypothetical protein n=1 Tax=Brevibacterium TaxID=1696 RepID=UPI00211C6900|nr:MULTISPECIES: hypothetical protein [unclassified Brevibacterium]MCQ9367374.1 hypothetical protein [Brevibacterium sp. 91QC2O2]MCQ9384613.1 hypothetical protein [Brevibacterium sp. 68QC2CO]
MLIEELNASDDRFTPGEKCEVEHRDECYHLARPAVLTQTVPLRGTPREQFEARLVRIRNNHVTVHHIDKAALTITLINSTGGHERLIYRPRSPHPAPRSLTPIPIYPQAPARKDGTR